MCRGNRRYINNGIFECFVSMVWISVPRELTEDLCLVGIASILSSPFSSQYSFFPLKKKKGKNSSILIFLAFPVCSNGLLYLRLFFSMHSPSVDSFSVTQYLSQIPDSSATSVVVLACSRRPMHVWSALLGKSN